MTTDKLYATQRHFVSCHERPHCRLIAKSWLGLMILTLLSASAIACPDFSGRYYLEAEPAAGGGYFDVKQKKCRRVEFDRETIEGGRKRIEKVVYIPDGELHDVDVPISHWSGERLQLGYTSQESYFLDANGSLHMGAQIAHKVK